MRFDKLFTIMKKSAQLKIYNVRGGQMYVFDGTAAYIFRDVPEIVQSADLFSIWGIEADSRGKYDVEVCGALEDIGGSMLDFDSEHGVPVKILNNLNIRGFNAVLLGQDETQLVFGSGDADMGYIPIRQHFLRVLSLNSNFDYVPATEDAADRVAVYEDGELCAVFYPMRPSSEIIDSIHRISDAIERFVRDE